jgi:hypothetical protein
MKIVKVPGEIKALVDELKQTRETLKAHRKREDAICLALKEHVGQQPATLQFNSQVIAMIEQKTSTRLDGDLIRATYPDAEAKCSVTTTYLQVKVT